MSDKTTRHGSLQFYPRVRARKMMPRGSWDYLSREQPGLLGFIGYKVGMKSAYVKDNTAHSMSKGQKIIVPVTIIECPAIKILSIRFYKHKKIVGDVLNSNLDKELKRKIRLPKVVNKKIEDFKEGEFDDIRVVVYSQVKKTGIKKAPDISEIGLAGNLDEKLDFAKKNFTKEISIKDVFKTEVVDIRGLTKGKGTQGIVKRYGANLKAHKSEKGQRTLGSGGPWHPSRVDYSQLRMGQMGFFTRVVYNNKIIYLNSIQEKNINPDGGFKHFGEIKTDYILVRGSIQGPAKRQLLITTPLRLSKKQDKKTYDFIEVR